MMDLRPWIVVATLAAAGCTQEIVVVQCDGHIDDGQPGDAATARTDSGLEQDAGVPSDTGAVGLDAAVTPDAGQDPCIGLRYCLRAATPDVTWAKVRQPVTITPDIQIVGNVDLVWMVDTGAVTGRRLDNRPALDPTELGLELIIEQATGVATLRVTSVPPWFFETTLIVPIQVSDTGGGPQLTVDAEVTIGGNTLISVGTAGIFAIDSGGHPASMGGMFDRGRIISDLVGSTRGILLLADGTLLVYDSRPRPHRLRRFRMTGADVHMGDFEYVTGQQEDVIQGDPTTVHMMAQLPNGKVVMAEHHAAGPSAEPHSWLLGWNADGTFDRRVVAGSPNEVWRGVGVAPDGDLLVMDNEGREVTRHDPVTLLPRGGQPFIDTLPGLGYGVLLTPSGDVYVSGDTFVIGVDAMGVASSVPGLPTRSTFWRALAIYGPDRVLATSSEQNDDGNIAVISGNRFEGPLRPSGVMGWFAAVVGVAHLR